MPYYRLYVSHPRTNRIINFEELQAASDEEAVSGAAAHESKFPLELWSGARLVARVDRDDQASSAAG